MSKRGRHTSTDKSIRKHIALFERSPLVKRVLLGVFENCRHSFAPGHIRIVETTPSGLRINMYCGDGVRRVFLCVNERDQQKMVSQIELASR